MIVTDLDPLDHRQPEHPILPLFPRRWSPRAMSGEAIPEGELMRLFESARWAPSSGNGQPWRFLWAGRDGEHWERYFGLLAEANRRWAGQAAVLVVVLSRTVREGSGKPIRTHSFDAGAAWMALALQGSAMGLVIHGMAGFDYERARRELAVPDDFAVEAMIAVGRPGDVDDLPEDLRLRERPSDRRPVAESAFEGGFPD